MRRRVNYSDYIESMVAYNIFNTSGGANSGGIEKVKSLLNEAVETILTPRQRLCVKMHYFNKMPMNKIARELGVNPSTVTRTIQAAKKKLSVLSFFL